MEKTHQGNTNRKEDGMAILISEELESRTGDITRNRGIFHNNKHINSSRKHNHPTCVCI